MKCWVFDLDGTLVDSFGPYFASLEKLINKELSMEERRNFIALHPLDVFNLYLESQAANQALLSLREQNKKDALVVEAFASTKAVLSELKETKRKVALWTSREMASTKIILEKNQLLNYFDFLVSGECVVEGKPHPEGLLKIQQYFNCETKDMVMIGDHDYDMLAAKLAGVYSVRASWHSHWQHQPCSLANQQFINNEDFHSWLVNAKV